MTQHKLIPYSVRVTKTRTSDPLTLGNLNNSGKDFFNILAKFLDKSKNTNVLDDMKKTLSVSNYSKANRDLYGLIKSGEYGLTADFFDTQNKTVTPLARKEKHSELYPFFFHFHLPKDLNEGKLIIQSFGVHGTQSVLQKTINDHLRPMEYAVDFHPLVSKNLLDQVERSRMVELRLIKKRVPKDVADKVYKGPVEDIIEERVYKVKRNGTLRITETLRDALENHDTQYYEILGENYDEVKTIVKNSGSSMTLTFSKHNSKFREAMVLERDIRTENGHPAYDELLKISKQYMKHLISNNGESSETAV